MTEYYTIKNFLSKEECVDVFEKCYTTLTLKRAIVGNQKLNEKVRKSSVAFIKDLGFVNDKLKKLLTNTIKVKGFDVSGINDFQFTEYNVGEYYGWHTDSNEELYKDRFYSAVIQLTDEYEEGDLQLKIKDTVITLERGIGNLFIFPSHFLHQVTPITSGVRYSLVNWVNLEKQKNSIKSLF